jgi:hypothetical protein
MLQMIVGAAIMFIGMVVGFALAVSIANTRNGVHDDG